MPHRVGDTLTIVVKGKVVSVSSGHGTCYKIQFPYEGYVSREIRQLWVEEHEILENPKEEMKEVQVNLKPLTDWI